MKPIGDEVKRELARFGPAAGLGEAVTAWPAAVGPAIAANAWPARIARDGTLHVATSSSAWAFELTQLEETVRAKLAERLEGDVPRALRFAPGPLPEPGEEAVKSSQRTVPRPSAAERAKGARIAAAIDDPPLREAVARAAAASLAAAERGSSDRSIW
jgi:predicted nucleic acid-binding Zn ribbon protein